MGDEEPEKGPQISPSLIQEVYGSSMSFISYFKDNMHLRTGTEVPI